MSVMRGDIHRNPKGKNIHSGPRVRADETPLRDHPEVFAEIFAGAEFPHEQVRKLMAAVALAIVKDYFAMPGKSAFPKQRRAIVAERERARQYIFNKDPKADRHVFSFASVCKAIGIDPDFARRGIQARSSADIKGIVQRLAFRRIDWNDDD